MSDDDGKTRGPDELSSVVRTWPGGRRLEVGLDDGREVLEFRAPGGEVELSVRMGDDGPVVRINAKRLEIDTPGQLSLRCGEFDLETRGGIKLRTGGEFQLDTESGIRMKAREQAFIDADWVNLNCQERSGYHDDPAKAIDVDAEEIDPATPSTEAGD